MSDNIPISFILPIYNVQDYLAEAIESILKQAVSKEIILVNDGSTDNSLAIALQYANKYSFIQVIHSQNKGVSAARNAGLRLARGEYVVFLDPDDYLDDNADFQSLYELAQTYQVPVVKGTYRKRFDHQLFLCKAIFDEVTPQTGYISSLIDCFTTALPDNWFIQIACFMIRRTVLLENQITFDTTLPFGEDTLFNVDLFSLEENVLEVGSPLVVYRSRPNSAMSQPITETRLISQYRLIEILRSRLEKTTNPVLKSCITQVISLNCRHLAQTIEHHPNLEKYQHLITEEMKVFMQYTQLNFFSK
ncbi:glycosyltransferase family 2 protein [Rodentibacter caecimuris]|uniref:glycosyltransferase family 2 protein n=1 Tax=Rodentibacter caecimuris TaxID=1796644 RepID=UPI00211A6A16|nr:glycosyltransferase family 2 protein [Rodentibacter heylii]MCQ9124171.1 glycosyltransferase [Rodentibacter heylii]